MVQLVLLFSSIPELIDVFYMLAPENRKNHSTKTMLFTLVIDSCKKYNNKSSAIFGNSPESQLLFYFANIQQSRLEYDHHRR